MIELVPPPPGFTVDAALKRPKAVVRIKPSIRYPAFLLQHQGAAEAINRRWGELAMHALFAEHAPGANPDTHGLVLVDHGVLAWVDWVEWKRQPSPRLSSWFKLNETWQSLDPAVGLEIIMREASKKCLAQVPKTLEALADATGLVALLPGAFGQLVRDMSPLPPEHIEKLAALVQTPRVVGSTIEFAGQYRGRIGRVSLDVVKAIARLETSLEVPARAPPLMGQALPP